MPQIALFLKISEATAREDWNRYLELRQESARDALEEHIAALNELLRRVNAALEVEVNPRAKAQLFGEVRQTIMAIAKLDGSLIQRSDNKVEFTNLRDVIQHFMDNCEEHAG